MFKRDNISKEPGLVREILDYFLRHPSTVDTCEGIARWRLAEERIRLTVIEVSESLDWLVNRGFLKFTLRAGFGPLYSLNERRLADATKFLMHGGKASGN